MTASSGRLQAERVPHAVKRAWTISGGWQESPVPTCTKPFQRSLSGTNFALPNGHNFGEDDTNGLLTEKGRSQDAAKSIWQPDILTWLGENSYEFSATGLPIARLGLS